MPHDPLTFRYGRTLDSIDDERRRAWWSDSAMDIERERRLREELAPPDTSPSPLLWIGAVLLWVLVIGGGLVLLLR